MASKLLERFARLKNEILDSTSKTDEKKKLEAFEYILKNELSNFIETETTKKINLYGPYKRSESLMKRKPLPFEGIGDYNMELMDYNGKGPIEMYKLKSDTGNIWVLYKCFRYTLNITPKDKKDQKDMLIRIDLVDLNDNVIDDSLCFDSNDKDVIMAQSKTKIRIIKNLQKYSEQLKIMITMTNENGQFIFKSDKIWIYSSPDVKGVNLNTLIVK
jgi:hypothetical protein